MTREQKEEVKIIEFIYKKNLTCRSSCFFLLTREKMVNYLIPTSQPNLYHFRHQRSSFGSSVHDTLLEYESCFVLHAGLSTPPSSLFARVQLGQNYGNGHKPLTLPDEKGCLSYHTAISHFSFCCQTFCPSQT